MAEVLISSSILPEKKMHSQVWSVLILIRQFLGLAQALKLHLWELKNGLSK
jgi:hypothetical protein